LKPIENKIFDSVDKLLLKHAYSSLMTVIIEASKRKMNSELLL
jgi:hypothetical protein